jgi:hypothetical protein
MKRTSRIMLLALGFGLVPVIFFFMHPRTAKAQSITAGSTVNSQISLFCNFSASAACVLSMLSTDGTTSAPFAIPAGQMLVLTDMECTVETVNPGEIGACALADPLNSITIVQAGSPSGPGKMAVVGLHLTTGIRLAFMPTVVISNTVATPVQPPTVTFQGYLIPTPPTPTPIPAAVK